MQTVDYNSASLSQKDVTDKFSHFEIYMDSYVLNHEELKKPSQKVVSTIVYEILSSRFAVSTLNYYEY